MTDTRKIGYGVILVLSTALLVLGAFFDKNIAELLYQPGNIGAIIMESAGIFPPFVFVGSMFTVLFYLVKEEDNKALLKRILTAAGVSLAYLVYGYMATDELMEGMLPRLLIALGTACLLTPLSFLIFRKMTRDRLKRLAIFLIFASMVSVISSLISVNVLKFFWGRPRYREMIADEDYLLEAFTPWYHLNGFTLHGHHSFPSGHTCSATNLLVLCALPEVFPEAEKSKKTVAVICGVYIFSMAYSRMVLGAHFLSDVTGGFLIGFLTYAIARYLYFDKSRIVVEAILEVNRGDEKFLAEETVTEQGESVEAPTPDLPTEGETEATSAPEGDEENSSAEDLPPATEDGE